MAIDFSTIKGRLNEALHSTNDQALWTAIEALFLVIRAIETQQKRGAL